MVETAIELHDDWLRVRLEQGHADFHFRWLRHNSDADRHPVTRERTLCSSELPDDLRLVRAEISGAALVAAWSDGASTKHTLAWLSEHAYARGRESPQPPPSDVGAITLEWSAQGVDALAEEALRRVRRDGVVLVRRRGGADPVAETEPLVDAFGRLGPRIIETHFGRIEDLRTDNTTNQNTDQLGYTDAGIQLHTDQPFLDWPPRYQVLQSIRPATRGGENFLVDARAAAKWFHSIDARDHELLATVPVRFHRKQKEFERVVVSPVLSHGPRGFQIRYSYFTMAPHQVPFETMSAWYRAYDRFARLVRDEKNQLRFTLSPGDFVLYDNLRMLHARTGFEGPRWVRGIYLDE